MTLTKKGKPKFVGVYFDDAALSGLPEGESDGSWDVVDPATGEIEWHCCGHETILEFPTCDIYDRAVAPLPADEQPPQNVNVNAVEPGMGNHLIDLSSPEFTGGSFSHTWIYGAYDGHITFHEPMITVAFFKEQHGEVCTPIITPQAMPEAGYYPTEYCIRYVGSQEAYAVTLESFQWFEASDGVLE